MEFFNDSILIGLEDTGHGYNLFIFLRKIGYTVLTDNSLLIKEFVKGLSYVRKRPM